MPVRTLYDFIAGFFYREISVNSDEIVFPKLETWCYEIFSKDRNKNDSPQEREISLKRENDDEHLCRKPII
jgi:hypothetical protein